MCSQELWGCGLVSLVCFLPSKVKVWFRICGQNCSVFFFRVGLEQRHALRPLSLRLAATALSASRLALFSGDIGSSLRHCGVIFKGQDVKSFPGTTSLASINNASLTSINNASNARDFVGGRSFRRRTNVTINTTPCLRDIRTFSILTSEKKYPYIEGQSGVARSDIIFCSIGHGIGITPSLRGLLFERSFDPTAYFFPCLLQNIGTRCDTWYKLLETENDRAYIAVWVVFFFFFFFAF